MIDSPLSFGVAGVLVISYLIASWVTTKKAVPDLSRTFLLFLVGPVTAEAVDIISIYYHHVVLKETIEMGVFKEHGFVIGFSAIALLFVALLTVSDSFRELPPRTKAAAEGSGK